MKVNNLEVHYNETLLSKASILSFFPQNNGYNISPTNHAIIMS